MFQAGSRGRQAHLDDRKTWQDKTVQGHRDMAAKHPNLRCSTLTQLSPLRSSQVLQVQMLCKDALFCWASKVWLSSLRGIRWGSDSSWRHRTTQGTTNGVAVASGRAKVEKPKRSSELTSHLKASEIFKSMSLVANYVETWEEVSLTQRGVKRPQVWDSMAHLTNDEEDWRLKKIEETQQVLASASWVPCWMA